MVIWIYESDPLKNNNNKNRNENLPKKIPTWKNTIVIYSKHSVFEAYYSKVYYTVYIVVFTTLC